MKLKYAGEVHLDEERDVVWSHLLDGQGERVMIVEMSRKFLADRHGVRWGDKRAVAAFRQYREEHLTAGAAALMRGQRRLKIYTRAA